MSRANPQRARQVGECEAIRLLQVIVHGSPEEVAAATKLAQKLIRSLALLKYMKPMGRPLSVLTPAELRKIALLDAHGLYTEEKIAELVGTTRDNVHYHLKPSAAMLAALLTAPSFIAERLLNKKAAKAAA